MILPDYKGGSIINLMSSISSALGHKPLYPPLKILPPSNLTSYDNIVVIVLDGLGYGWLRKHGKCSFMHSHLQGKMTSVFPPTTASAITTFNTGLAPQQHAITEWFMNLKELGAVVTILGLRSRNGVLLETKGVDMKNIIGAKPLYNSLRSKSYYVLMKKVAKSSYTKAVSGNATLVPYTNLSGFFRGIKKVLNSRTKRKYVFAYWPDLDAFSHLNGTAGRKTINHFRQLDKQMSRLADSLRGTNTAVIVTSDHGLIDTEKSKFIYLDNHPKLKETLTLPLCGGSRTLYCYVRPSKTRDFERYVRNKLGHCCSLYKSEDLIKKNWFGLFAPHPRLYDRIGDYVLVMKENYVLRDFVMGEKKEYYPGHHCGLSREEMLVPLIFFEKK